MGRRPSHGFPDGQNPSAASVMQSGEIRTTGLSPVRRERCAMATGAVIIYGHGKMGGARRVARGGTVAAVVFAASACGSSAGRSVNPCVGGCFTPTAADTEFIQSFCALAVKCRISSGGAPLATVRACLILRATSGWSADSSLQAACLAELRSLAGTTSCVPRPRTLRTRAHASSTSRAAHSSPATLAHRRPTAPARDAESLTMDAFCGQLFALVAADRTRDGRSSSSWPRAFSSRRPARSATSPSCTGLPRSTPRRHRAGRRSKLAADRASKKKVSGVSVLALAVRPRSVEAVDDSTGRLDSKPAAICARARECERRHGPV